MALPTTSFDFRPLYALRTDLETIKKRGGGNLFVVPRPPITTQYDAPATAVPWRVETTKRGEVDYLGYSLPLYSANYALWVIANTALSAGLPWPLRDGLTANTLLTKYDPTKFASEGEAKAYLRTIFDRTPTVAEALKGLDEGLRKMDPAYPTARFPLFGVFGIVLVAGLGVVLLSRAT